MRFRSLLLLIAVVFCFRLNAQKEVLVIAFWNVENLFDTINDPLKLDDEYTPKGALAWTSERYNHKISCLSEAISRIGNDISIDGAALVGLCEIENARVLEDLVNTPALKERGYKAILVEGPDRRGIDPALLYNPTYFKHQKTSTVPIHLPDTTRCTRDILIVNGDLGGEPVSVFVNHWPSRRGGERASRPSRIVAAKVARMAADSIRRVDPKRKIVIMGDFNDDPVNYSVKGILCSQEKKEQAEGNCFFNPMTSLYKRGVGTLAFNDRWNLFDQLMFSKEWLGDESGWTYSDAKVYNKSYLCSQEGNFNGYPFRTYNSTVYAGGYSDHFPSYVIVTRNGK